MKTRKILVRMFQEKASHEATNKHPAFVAGMCDAIELVAETRSGRRAKEVDDVIESYFTLDGFGEVPVETSWGRGMFDGFCDALDCVGLLPQGVRR